MNQGFKRPAAIAAASAWLLAAGTVGAQTAPAAPVAPTPAAPTPAAEAPAAITAPAITADGALALSRALGDALTALLPAPTGKGGVVVSGPPIAMPDGDHYLVALPPVSLRGQDQQRLDIASIRLTVKPLADQSYAISAQIPASLVYVEEGDPAAVLTLGEQKISGVWSPRLASFLSLDLSFGDVQMTSVYDDYWLGVAAVSYTQDLRPENGAGNGWGGPAALALTDIRLDKGDNTLLSIGGVTSENLYSRFRLDKGASLLKLAEGVGAGGPEPKPADVLALFKGMIGGVASRVRITDFTAQDPDSEMTVSFEQASVISGVSDLDRELGAAEFGVDVKGLSFEPAPTAEAALPSAADFRISLRNLPVGKLLQLAEAALGPNPPAGDPMALLLETADAAKLTVKLDSLGATTAAMQGQATGEATARKDAAFGAVGKAKLTIGGVDKLLNDLKPKKNAKPDPETADLVGMLTMVKAMGRPEKDKDGKPVSAFTFELTPQGTVLVNDADIAPLLEGGGETKGETKKK